MSFHVGQKVVCVDDRERVSQKDCGFFGRFRKYRRLHHNLNKGDIYPVTGVGVRRCDRSGEYYEMLLLGGAWHFGHTEIGFPSFQFRPLLERKTDISIFTAMLTPTKQGVDA